MFYTRELLRFIALCLGSALKLYRVYKNFAYSTIVLFGVKIILCTVQITDIHVYTKVTDSVHKMSHEPRCVYGPGLLTIQDTYFRTILCAPGHLSDERDEDSQLLNQEIKIHTIFDHTNSPKTI